MIAGDFFIVVVRALPARASVRRARRQITVGHGGLQLRSVGGFGHGADRTHECEGRPPMWARQERRAVTPERTLDARFSVGRGRRWEHALRQNLESLLPIKEISSTTGRGERNRAGASGLCEQ